MVDLVFGDDDRRGESQRCLVRLLDQDSAPGEFLADWPAEADVRREFGAGPKSPAAYLGQAVTNQRVQSGVQVRPEILECHMVAGGFDYLVKTRVADMEAYRRFAGTVLWQLPGVRETRTYAVMEEVKSSAKLHLG